MSKQFKHAKEFANLSKSIDMELLRDSIKSCFGDYPNPRKTDRVIYPSWYILLIIIMGVLSNCDSIAEIAEFAVWRADLLQELIGEKIGVPKYDVFRNLLVFTKPEGLKELLKEWFHATPEQIKDQLLIIDGKRVRRASKQGPLIHFVELFSAEDRLTIAQEKVPDKEGEKAGLNTILETVDVRGSILSLDALFTTKETARAILDKEADYILALKGNQEKFHDEVIHFFEEAKAIQYEGVNVECFESLQKGHGRVEKRTIRICSDLYWLPQKDSWKGLRTIIEVESVREIKGKQEISSRYYISSRESGAEQFSKWVRGHWSIENSLHWVADVIFREDSGAYYSGHSTENMGIIKRFALNILRTSQPLDNLASARRASFFEPNFLKSLIYKIFVK